MHQRALIKSCLNFIQIKGSYIFYGSSNLRDLVESLVDALGRLATGSKTQQGLIILEIEKSTQSQIDQHFWFQINVAAAKSESWFLPGGY